MSEIELEKQERNRIILNNDIYLERYLLLPENCRRNDGGRSVTSPCVLSCDCSVHRSFCILSQRKEPWLEQMQVRKLGGGAFFCPRWQRPGALGRLSYSAGWYGLYGIIRLFYLGDILPAHLSGISCRCLPSKFLEWQLFWEFWDWIPIVSGLQFCCMQATITSIKIYSHLWQMAAAAVISLEKQEL